MKKIEISSQSNKISAIILPDYGGMVARLRIGSKDIFYLNEDLVEVSPILAGGSPVLFPFSGSIVNDSYELCGKTYTMPPHGLVKNSCFAASCADKSHAKLCASNSETQKDANYPFDFLLELDYSISEEGITLAATMHNKSTAPMPHTFGWHPYFTATDKSKFSLQLPMHEYIDVNKLIHPSDGHVDAKDPIDSVFYKRTQGNVIIQNPADGYEAVIQMDEAYQVVTVWSTPDAFVCVEPWVGVPDAINNGRYLRCIPAGGKETCAVKIQIKEI